MSASRQAALLYEHHRQRLLGLCRGRLASRADAEDALQQTFVYALRCLDRGVVPQNEAAWLNTIAENVCRAWTRNGARRTRRETEADIERVPEPRSEADRVGDARDLAAALAVLPFAQRRALLLREWHGLSYREVAAELSTTESAVETLIFRARRRAAAALTDARRLLDVGTAFAGLRRALGTLGAKGGAVAAAAGCVTVAAAVPLARTLQPHRHRTPSAPAIVHVSAVEPHARAVLRVEPIAPQPRRALRLPMSPKAPVSKAPVQQPVAAVSKAPVQQPLAAAARVAPPPAPTVEPAPTAPTAAAPTHAGAPAARPAAPVAAAPATAPAPAAPVDAAGTVATAVNTAGSAVDTATTAVGSVVDSAKPAVPAPPAVPAVPPVPAPVPAVPPVTTPALP